MAITDEEIRAFVQYIDKTRRLTRKFQKGGRLRPGAMGVLNCLSDHTSAESPELKPSEISGFMEIRQPSVTPILRDLEEAGYIRRRHGTSDRRNVYFSLTESGREVVKTHRDQHVQSLRELLDYLGEKDGRTLMCLSARAMEYMAKSNEKLEEDALAETV